MTTIEQGAKVGLRAETLMYGTAAGPVGGVYAILARRSAH